MSSNKKKIKKHHKNETSSSEEEKIIKNLKFKKGDYFETALEEEFINKTNKNINLISKNPLINEKKIKEKPEVQRFIIYVSGLEQFQNTPLRLYNYFSKFGLIKAIQPFSKERFALIEFHDPKSAYNAVTSKEYCFDNKFIEINFASIINEEILESIKKDFLKNKFLLFSSDSSSEIE